MTTAINQRVPFGGVTAMGGPLDTPLMVIAGYRHTILHADKVGEQVVLLGESEDLGSEPLALDNSGVTSIHVLTAEGMTIINDDDAPEIVTAVEFNPGGGKWIVKFGSFVATPLAHGGVQILNATTGAQVTAFTGLTQDSRHAAALRTQGFLWICDSRAAKLHAIKIDLTTGAMQYIGKVDAPNCRDVIKVVLDENNGNLFVVCRRRIVRFTVPFASVTDVEDLLPEFAQSYPVQTVDYTDFAVIDENQYWIGVDSVDGPLTTDLFYGPTYGIWNGEMIVAAPRASVLTANNVVPYYDEDDIGISITGYITTAAPVITSPVGNQIVIPGSWSYTITATGTPPIYFDTNGPWPSWVTDVNHLTGLVSGTPPAPSVSGVYTLPISAANPGGTDTDLVTLIRRFFVIADLNGATGNDTNIFWTSPNVGSTAAHVSGYVGQMQRSGGLDSDKANDLCIVDESTMYICGEDEINYPSLNYSSIIKASVYGTIDTSFAVNHNLDVYTLAVYGDSLFVGGFFTAWNGDSTKKFLMELDRRTGLPVANPLTFTAGAGCWVSCLKVVGNILYGSLVRGTSDGTIQGQSRNAIFAIDLTTRLLLPLRNTGTMSSGQGVNDFEVVGDTIYMVGGFTGFQGATRNNAAALTISTNALHAWNPNLNGIARGIAVKPDGNIAVGGVFTTAAGGTARRGYAVTAAADGALQSGNPFSGATVSGGCGRMVNFGGYTWVVGGTRTYANSGNMNTLRSKYACIRDSDDALMNWNSSYGTGYATGLIPIPY